MERNEEDMMKQQLDLHHQRRMKPPQAVVQPENQTHHHQHQAPPQQPQKCPRCESLNTKFCYYNNYSLTQPRYFCKACRRYWTHGGTLRNVPVGGGCRKGKRTKTNSSSTSSASSGESSRSQQQPPPPPPHDLQVLDNLSTSLALRNKEIGGNLGIPQLSSYYSGGGFLSSLAAMQSMNQPQQSFNQIGHQFGGSSSNLALLQGFNLPSLGSQQVPNQQIQHQNDQFYQMGNRDNNKSTIQSFYPSENQSLVHPNRPIGSWNHQSLINNNSTPNPSDQSSNPSNFWIGTSGSGTSLNPNQWPPHHLP